MLLLERVSSGQANCSLVVLGPPRGDGAPRGKQADVARLHNPPLPCASLGSRVTGSLGAT